MTRAEARAFAQHIAAEMHAVTVNRIRRYLGAELGADEPAVDRWARHWTEEGLRALEAALARQPSDQPFCFGLAPGLADLHLVPQLRNARRFGCDLAPYPRLLAVEARCVELDAFRRARPENQPDHPGSG